MAWPQARSRCYIAALLIHDRYFDGSGDILVKTALEDALARRINLTKRRGQKLLVVDEYHMLSEAHKRDLFYWLRGKLVAIHVLLIANRFDRNDEQLLRECSAEVCGGSFDETTAVSPPLQVSHELWGSG